MATTKKSAKTKARLGKALHRAKNEAQAAKAKAKPKSGKETEAALRRPLVLSVSFASDLDWAEVSTLLPEAAGIMAVGVDRVLVQLLRKFFEEREAERRSIEDVAMGCVLTHGRGALGLIPSDKVLTPRFRRGLRDLWDGIVGIVADVTKDQTPLDTLTAVEAAVTGGADQKVALAHATRCTGAYSVWTAKRYAEGFQGGADDLPREALQRLAALEPVREAEVPASE